MEFKHAEPQIPRYTLGKIFTLLFAILFQISCFAQGPRLSSDDKKALKKYEEAQQNYQKRQLNEALSLLGEAIERDPKFIEAHTLMAYIHLDQAQYSEAKKKFHDAIAVDPLKIPNNLFFLAELEIQDGEYEKAGKYYRQYLASKPADQSLLNRTNRGLDKVDFALEQIKNPVAFSPENLGESINSEFAEYFPCLTVDESLLLFTRRLPFPDSPQGFNEDFFYATKNSGATSWSKAINMGNPINTKFNEGAPSLSADGQLLFFTACELYGDYGGDREGLGSCDLFYTLKKGSNWAPPRNLGNTINSGHWETQPSFSSDGKTLYFVRGKRTRTGNRTGDIYYSELSLDGYWSEPVPLPKNINTPGNEESVHIHPDGKTLYFASNGHLGMGGLDLYKTTRNADGSWSNPINLGYPINTYKNENSLLVSANGKEAYFASDREGGYGDLDLYKFVLPESLRPNTVSYFAGKIVDKKTRQPMQARFELIDLTSQELVVESFSDPINGSFLVSLPTGRDYALNASKDGYLFYSENFSMGADKQLSPVKKNVLMQPIEIGESIVLKNIFFETASYDLKNQSLVELKKLTEFLKQNPTVKVEISGHTDTDGNAEINQVLSQNRAQSVLGFLSDQGISNDRLKAVGYGSSKPVASNETEAGKAKNRRTEFKIIAL